MKIFTASVREYLHPDFFKDEAGDGVLVSFTRNHKRRERRIVDCFIVRLSARWRSRMPDLKLIDCYAACSIVY